MNIIHGDILLATDDVIGHQCNCKTTISKGLASYIFERFPWANSYITSEPRIVGTTVVYGNGKDKRYVANIYGQYNVGRTEEKSKRLKWFNDALEMLCDWITKNDKRTLGLPFNIGCGLAGGDWESYLKIICVTSHKYKNISITIYKP